MASELANTASKVHEAEHVHGEHCKHGHGHEQEQEHDEDVDIEEDDEEETEEAEEDTMNRGEKKARKMLSKAGMKAVLGIERVSIKRGRMVFAIANPTVYRTSNDCYIVFGEAKMEDGSMQMQASIARRLAEVAQAGGITAEDGEEESSEEAPAAEAETAEAVDEEGVDAKDVAIVMEQAGVSRAKAVAALKANSNDIVNTIMELTT